MSTGSPQPYTVTDQKHSIGPRADGTFGGIWTIYATAHGVDYSVNVPDEQYNAVNVHQLLFAKAGQIAAVASLPGSIQEGPPPPTQPAS